MLKNEENIGVAMQIPNPSIDTWGTAGKMLGDSMVQLEGRLTQEIELGGKRSSRVKVAETKNKYISLQLLQSKEETAIATIRTLYRLRQIESEKGVLKRAFKTWNTISQQYRSRPALNPEQQVSLTVFQLAMKESQLLQSQLEVERLGHAQFLETATGTTIDLGNLQLPEIKSKWPILQETSDLKNSQILIYENDIDQSLSLLENSKSQQIPNLRLGPIAQAQTQGPISFFSLGVSLGLSLPIMHNYGSQVDFGRKSLEQSQSLYDIMKYRLSVEKKREYAQYHLALETLERAGTLDSIDSAFTTTEKLFYRGVLPSYLVIEANRQMLDVVRSVNDQELVAIESLWRIYILEGRFEDESLD
ncbi:MAG: TolC family protein [Xanthomonadaceae bacterium]|nr:TolC family protein [Xanthomonadaceae bacterium]